VGASAIVAYTLCAQIAQPVYGLTAAGLHFLFPYIAFRRVRDGDSAARSIVLRGTAANGFLVAVGTATLFAFSHPMLRLLASEPVARASSTLLPAVLLGSAILALTVSGAYAMLALGCVRPVAAINVVAALAMLAAVTLILPATGVWGIIGGRLAFALTACVVYVPLFRRLKFGRLATQPGLLEARLAEREGA
jgi:Na+-driven multidrug efflux pump